MIGWMRVGPGARAWILGCALTLPVCATAENAGPEMGPSMVTSTYGDWSVRCRQGESGQAGAEPSPERFCELFQAANLNQRDGQVMRLTEIAIGRLPGNREYSVLVRTPHHTALARGVAIIAEPAPGKEKSADIRLPLEYLTCDGQGCLADTRTQREILEAMAGAGKARIEFYDRNGRVVPVPLSVHGMKAALHALDAP